MCSKLFGFILMLGSCLFTLILPILLGFFMQAVINEQDGEISSDRFKEIQTVIGSTLLSANLISAFCEWV